MLNSDYAGARGRGRYFYFPVLSMSDSIKLSLQIFSFVVFGFPDRFCFPPFYHYGVASTFKFEQLNYAEIKSEYLKICKLVEERVYDN
jgi:hypothetical protein